MNKILKNILPRVHSITNCYYNFFLSVYIYLVNIIYLFFKKSRDWSKVQEELCYQLSWLVRIVYDRLNLNVNAELTERKSSESSEVRVNNWVRFFFLFLFYLQSFLSHFLSLSHTIYGIIRLISLSKFHIFNITQNNVSCY